jgi:hypothetical protein
MDSTTLTFLFIAIIPFVLYFYACARLGKSILCDLRGPESKSFWLGTTCKLVFDIAISPINDSQGTSRNMCTKRKLARQNLSGCVNTALLGAFEGVWA